MLFAYKLCWFEMVDMDFTVSGNGMTFFFYFCRLYSYSAMMAGVMFIEETLLVFGPVLGDFCMLALVFFLRWGGSMLLRGSWSLLMFRLSFMALRLLWIDWKFCAVYSCRCPITEGLSCRAGENSSEVLLKFMAYLISEGITFL